MTTGCVFQVGHLREVSNKTHNAELKLFLEVEFGPVIHSYSMVVITCGLRLIAVPIAA